MVPRRLRLRLWTQGWIRRDWSSCKWMPGLPLWRSWSV